MRSRKFVSESFQREAGFRNLYLFRRLDRLISTHVLAGEIVPGLHVVELWVGGKYTQTFRVREVHAEKGFSARECRHHCEFIALMLVRALNRAMVPEKKKR